MNNQCNHFTCNRPCREYASSCSRCIQQGAMGESVLGILSRLSHYVYSWELAPNCPLWTFRIASNLSSNRPWFVFSPLKPLCGQGVVSCFRQTRRANLISLLGQFSPMHAKTTAILSFWHIQRCSRDVSVCLEIQCCKHLLGNRWKGVRWFRRVKYLQWKPWY